jgi:protocatechuate 3,4-dioxygenase beta subunit
MVNGRLIGSKSSPTLSGHPGPAPLDLGLTRDLRYGQIAAPHDGVHGAALQEAQGHRPPHIHFQLTGRADRLVTQMWFPGDPLNAQDRLFTILRASAQQMVTARIESPTANLEPESTIAVFNIVVPNG